MFKNGKVAKCLKVLDFPWSHILFIKGLDMIEGIQNLFWNRYSLHWWQFQVYKNEAIWYQRSPQMQIFRPLGRIRVSACTSTGHPSVRLQPLYMIFSTTLSIVTGKYHAHSMSLCYEIMYSFLFPST